MRVFLSYRFNSPEEILVKRVYFHLSRQPDIQPYFFPHQGRAGDWEDQLRESIILSDAVVFFWGEKIGKTQQKEAAYAIRNKRTVVPVKLPGSCDIDSLHRLSDLEDFTSIDDVSNLEDASAFKCAKSIMGLLKKTWVSDDGLPTGYPFEYEKDIIREFMGGHGKLSLERVKEGCPRTWPVLKPKAEADKINSVKEDEIGSYRDWDKDKKCRLDPQVVVAALADFHSSQCMIDLGLTFPEAGPRMFHYYPKEEKVLTVGILVSGGIAPGINSVISEIKKRQVLYAERGRWTLRILGYPGGFKPLILRGKGITPDRGHLYPRDTDWPAEIDDETDHGGSILPTSRAHKLTDFDHPMGRMTALQRLVDNLYLDEIDILYVIGGDGSMKAAHAVWKYAQNSGYDFSVVAVPKTMDNDILWVWQSFGFLSAVEWAKGAIRHLHKEATSNPRLCVIQLFGSDSGYVVSHAGLASGVCDLVLIPEVKFAMPKVIDHVTKKLRSRFKTGTRGTCPYGIVLMAENAIPLDAQDYLSLPEVGLTEREKEAIRKFEEGKRRVHGQTPDDLRRAGLKIVAGVLQKNIREMQGAYWEDFRVFTNEPRHLIRSIPPSSADITFAQRLGSLAVDCAMAGYTDFMISQWLTEYVMVPLELVVLGRKRIPKSGIFWKSVRAKTGQDADLT